MIARKIDFFGLFLLACSAPWSYAEARNWEALYAFGDSYTDSGAGYIDGNGPTAVVYVAKALGIPFTYAGDRESSGKGLNFAVSGAQTGKNDGVRIRPATAECGSNEALVSRGMQTQVQDFSRGVEAGALRFDPGKTVFFIAGGLNDGPLPTSTTIANLEGEIRRLYDLGGRYFLVALLPTKIPAFSDVGTRLNPGLAKIPEDMRAVLHGIHIKSSKWGVYFDQVIENPSKYGIRNTTDRCAGQALWGEDPTPCSAPDTYFYFHDGHPSTAVQQIVARELEREMLEAFR